VTEVSVNLNQGVETLLKAPGESGAVGTAQSPLARASHKRDGTETIGDLLSELGSSIGAGVIDDQYVGVRSETA
jgi:hypothetical protein